MEASAASTEKDARSVFVRGIPFEMSDADLEDAFSRLGPVRNAFAVRDVGEAWKNRGYGIVQYALMEDALRAVSEMDGKEVHGRIVRVEMATRKNRRSEIRSIDPSNSVEDPTPTVDDSKTKKEWMNDIVRDEKKEEERIKASSESSGPSEKQKVARTIAMGNLSERQVEEAIRLARKQDGVLEVIHPASREQMAKRKLEQDGCKGEVVFVEFGSVSQALQAVGQLHGKKLSGGGRLWARQLGGEGARLKRWRVIVRNLPFDVSEKDLRQAFRGCGLLWDVKLPRSADGSARGFAFVGFISSKQTEDAIKKVNGSLIRNRRVAVDWALSKHDYMAKTEEPEHEGGSDHPSSDQKGPESGPGTNRTERAEEDLRLEGKQSRKEVRGIESSMEAKPRQRPAKSSDGNLANTAVGGVSSDPSKSGAPAVATESPSYKTKKPDKQVNPGRDKTDSLKRPFRGSLHPIRPTVYIRNLPPTTNKENLMSAMSEFGIVRECRVVLGNGNEKCDGTAYIEFVDRSCAELLIEAASSSSGQGVVFRGRALKISPALSSQEARKLKSDLDADKKLEKSRNLSLSKEGSIPEGSSKWQELSIEDQEKRRNAEREKKTKLASPNFVVSSTRLSVRNIPLDFSEKQLKDLFVGAVKEKATKQNPVVKQVKILRDADKLGKDGLPVSKGLGFVEFKEHQHAVVALRALNNNPSVFRKERRPIVEFAIENMKILKARESRLKMAATNDAHTKRQSDIREEKNLVRGTKKAETKLGKTTGKTGRPTTTTIENGHQQEKKSKPQGSSEATKAHKRKLEQDTLLDMLAKNEPLDAAKTSNSRREQKRKKSKVQEEGFEALVKQYKAKYFGVRPEAKQDAFRKGLSRWFE